VGKLVPGGFMPSEDMGYLLVNIQLPDAASMQRADVVARKGGKIIEAHEEVEYITTARVQSALQSMSSNAGFIFSPSRTGASGRRPSRSWWRQLNRDFFHGNQRAAQVFAFGPPAIPGLGNGSGFTLMLQDRAGNTPNTWPSRRQVYPGRP
jgi:HAE1 family hydrophobic/amphiphilic exporter-1